MIYLQQQLVTKMLLSSLKLDSGSFLTTEDPGDNFSVLLSVIPGERPYALDYGNEAHQLIQGRLPLGLNETLVLDRFQSTLKKYLPSNLQVVNINITSDDTNRIVDITVDYTLVQ